MLIPCTVHTEAGGNVWIVTFKNGATLCLQSDYGQRGFASSCGKCDGDNMSDPAYIDLDPATITECPDNYLEIADAA